jgi:hypothetical protein
VDLSGPPVADARVGLPAHSALPERVRLTIPGLGAVEAWVARAVPGAAELVFAARPPAPARLLHRRAAILDALAATAPGPLHALLLAVPDARGALRPDAVHALFDAAALGAPAGAAVPAAARPAPPGAASRPAFERRAADRVQVLRAVSLHHPGVAAGIHARTDDVSAAGVGIVGAYELTRGDVVRVRLMLEQTRALEAIGEVRRQHTGSARHGVQLVRMRPQDRLWLERWLARERAAALAALRA